MFGHGKNIKNPQGKNVITNLSTYLTLDTLVDTQRVSSKPEKLKS